MPSRFPWRAPGLDYSSRTSNTRRRRKYGLRRGERPRTSRTFLTSEGLHTMGIHRIGLVVPSSNVTVETEMPALLGRHPDVQFSFHSSRMRMQAVSPEQLRAMNAQRERCILELGDAGVDAVLYACLVALMSAG